MFGGTSLDLFHCGLSDSSCRIVDYPSESLVIVRVYGNPEIGYDILDFLTLVK